MTPLERYLPFITQHPLHRTMGITGVEAGNGQAHTAIMVGADMVNPIGMFHGGVVYTLSDMICYAALLSVLREGENAATHDIHISMLRAARLGDRVSFSGKVIKRGRSIAFMEAEVRCGERLLARASVTKSILRDQYP